MDTPRPAQEPERARLLIVEDEPIIAAMLQDLFSRAGLDVVVATSVAAALEALSSVKFDLCLTDFLLPDQTGLDLARLAGSLQPELRIVLASAYLEPEVENAVRALPSVVEVVRKPMNVVALRERVLRLATRRVETEFSRGSAPGEEFGPAP